MSLRAAFPPSVRGVGGVDYASRTNTQTGIGTQKLSDKIMVLYIYIYIYIYTHTQRVLVGKPEGNRLLERSRRRWAENITR